MNWTKTTLGQICSNQAGLQTGPFGSQLHASEYIDKGIPVVMPKDMRNQRISVKSIAQITTDKANDLEKHRLRVGDVIFGRRGEIGRCALVTKQEEDWICGTGCLRARLRHDISPEYIIYYLGIPSVIYWLQSNAVGQTMLNLNTSILAALPVILPPLEEQRKIAEILGAWDDTITLTERLIDAKQERKKGLMQQLLTGKMRFPGFEGEWKTVRLKDIGQIHYGKSPNKIRDANGLYPIYGTSGIVGSTNTILCNLPAVIIGRKGTINQPRFVEQPFWAIDTTFYCLPKDNVEIRWLYYMLHQLKLARYNEATGVPSLSRSNLYPIKLCLPPVSEQKKIATILKSCDDELSLLQRKAAALRQQKKGLMQQLLTGKVRVKV